MVLVFGVIASTFLFVSVKPAASQTASGDMMFAKKAAQGGMAEVKMGELAQKNGSSQTVKDFGQHMVQDHSKANDRLKDVAAKNSINLPSELNSKDQATYEKLSKLSGSAFDRAYANDMVKDHEADISDFKEEAASGQNEDVKNFASQTLPTLEDHLKMAEQMRQSVNGSGSHGAE
jgi:putative membrane protein